MVSKMRNAKKRIQSYIENPLIGQEKVENFLDDLHAIRFQTQRYEITRVSKQEILNEEIKRYKNVQMQNQKWKQTIYIFS